MQGETRRFAIMSMTAGKSFCLSNPELAIADFWENVSIQGTTLNFALIGRVSPDKP